MILWTAVTRRCQTASRATVIYDHDLIGKERRARRDGNRRRPAAHLQSLPQWKTSSSPPWSRRKMSNIRNLAADGGRGVPAPGVDSPVDRSGTGRNSDD